MKSKEFYNGVSKLAAVAGTKVYHNSAFHLSITPNWAYTTHQPATCQPGELTCTTASSTRLFKEKYLIYTRAHLSQQIFSFQYFSVMLSQEDICSYSVMLEQFSGKRHICVFFFFKCRWNRGEMQGFLTVSLLAWTEWAWADFLCSIKGAWWFVMWTSVCNWTDATSLFHTDN